MKASDYCLYLGKKIAPAKDEGKCFEYEKKQSNSLEILNIIICDVWNTKFDIFHKRRFETQTAVSKLENLVCPDLSVYGE